MEEAVLDAIEQLCTRWGELHIDIYAGGAVVLSDTNVYLRNSAHARLAVVFDLDLAVALLAQLVHEPLVNARRRRQ